MLLDGKTPEVKKAEELRNILKTAWWKKNAIELQDVDFAETFLDVVGVQVPEDMFGRSLVPGLNYQVKMLNNLNNH